MPAKTIGQITAAVGSLNLTDLIELEQSGVSASGSLQQVVDLVEANINQGSSYFDDDGGTPGVAPSAGASDAIAIGAGASAAGIASIAIGLFAEASGDDSTAFGRDTNSTHSGSLVFGRGVDNLNKLASILADTVSFGVNSDVPTLSVTGASGAGTYGNVLIGKTTNDSINRLQVSGSIVSEVRILEKAADHTLVLTDASSYIRMNVAGANTLTVPTNASVAFPVGTSLTVIQAGAGQTTIAGDIGVTINSSGGLTNVSGQYSTVTLVKVATDEWDLVGDLA